MDEKLCECGSGRSVENCCRSIISGKRQAESCLELMRSRYSAFVQLNVEYLIKSHHSSTRNIREYKSSKTWMQSVKWIGLTIIRTKDGEKNDETGYVEFRALYFEAGKMQQIHELSFFRRENGNWKYVSGEHFPN